MMNLFDMASSVESNAVTIESIFQALSYKLDDIEAEVSEIRLRDIPQAEKDALVGYAIGRRLDSVLFVAHTLLDAGDTAVYELKEASLQLYEEANEEAGLAHTRESKAS